MRRYVVFAVLLLAAMTLMVSSAFGQAETGQITGTVLDQTGAALPGAEVTAKNLATGTSRSSVTNSSGVYTIPNLQPSTYEVSIGASGFSTFKQTVAVGPGVRVGVDAQMKLGTTTTTVEVIGTAVAINTETQSLTSVIDSKSVTELPSLTRNPYDFVATLPNVAGDTQSGRGVGYAINGMRSSSTNVLLDGVANNDEFTGTVGQSIPLDAVQEYSVTTNSFTAEVGRASGGVVNVSTKSGTNAFHGTAYEFNRVSALGSNSFYNNANSLPKQIYDRNQYGFSIGGPVKKNKLFFFEDTEWTRVRSSANQVTWIPTPQFIGAANANTQAFFQSYGKLRSDLTTLATVTKGDLAARGQSCAAGGLCAALPSSTPMFSQVTYRVPADAGGGSPQNTYNLVARVDYNLSEKSQLYFRYAKYNELDFAGTVNTSPYAGYDTGQTNINDAYVVSFTHTFSPTFVSQTKLNYNRLNNQQPLGTAPVGPTLYMSSGAAVNISGIAIAYPGYNEYTPGSAIPFGGPQNFATINEDLSKVIGKHDFRFGGQYTYFQDNRVFGAYEEAVEALGTKWSNQIENFLVGNINSFQAAIFPQGKFPGDKVTLPVGPPDFTRSNRYKEGALYAQDSWKISRRLTLNLGVRWEYYGVQHDKNPSLDANYYWGSGSTIQQMMRSGQAFTVPNSPIKALWNSDPHNFAPRVGFAWDVFGDGKTSLRGGYGIGYERNFGNVTFNVIQNPPNYAVVSLVAGTDLPTIPISVSNAGPLAGSTGTKTLPNVSLRFVDNNIKTAYAHLFSLSTEHQFGKEVVGSVSYSGSMGENLYSIAHYNLPGYGNFYLGDPCKPGTDGDPGTCTARLRTTQYSNINTRTNGGISNYNALIGRVVLRNFWKTGVTLDMNYTYSHAIDNLSSTFSDGTQGNYQLGFLDPFHPSVDRGNSDFDARHRVAVSGIWQIPIFKGNSLRDKILGGWELDPIFTARTGNPFTLYDCGNALSYCPRAFVDGAVPTSGQTNVASANGPDNFNYLDFAKLKVASWFDPKTGISDVGTFPNNMVGRNTVRAPGIWNLDLGIYKTTRLSERFKLQLRLELYNAFNHANFYVYGVDTDVASYGFVDGFRDGHRNIQLAAKFIF
jgi:outer membrane receptor protein involved in Fe transport